MNKDEGSAETSDANIQEEDTKRNEQNKMEKFKIQISGRVESDREKKVKTLEKEYWKHGIRLLNYRDKGASGSYATFIGPKDNIDKAKNIQKTIEAKSKKTTQSIIAFVLVIIILAVSHFTADPTKSRRKSEPDIHGAWAYTQLFVKDKLKSPKSADFPFGGSSGVTPLGKNRYRVVSYVDSQNSFGATIRTNFTCIIKKKNDSWELEQLQFHK